MRRCSRGPGCTAAGSATRPAAARFRGFSGSPGTCCASSLERRRVETEARHRLGLEYRDVTVEPDAGWLIDGEGEIEAALTRLPAAERDAIALRVVESLSYRDVASRLDCSEAAARVRVHRGLSRLRAILEEAAL